MNKAYLLTTSNMLPRQKVFNLAPNHQDSSFQILFYQAIHINCRRRLTVEPGCSSRALKAGKSCCCCWMCTKHRYLVKQTSYWPSLPVYILIQFTCCPPHQKWCHLPTHKHKMHWKKKLTVPWTIVPLLPVVLLWVVHWHHLP